MEKTNQCPRCGGVNLKWAPHRALGCADCGWEASDPAVDLSAYTDGGTHKLYPGMPKVEPVQAHKHTAMPLTRYEFPAYPELKDGCLALTRRMSTYILDTMDKRIVDAVIEEARRAGLTDVFILDRKWVMDALREKMERSKGCEFCNRFDFTSAKIEVNKYGAHICLATAGTVFATNERLKYCPNCGRKLEVEE